MEYLIKLLNAFKYLFRILKKILKPAINNFFSEISENMIKEIYLEIKKRGLLKEEKNILEKKIKIEEKEKEKNATKNYR